MFGKKQSTHQHGLCRCVGSTLLSLTVVTRAKACRMSSQEMPDTTCTKHTHRHTSSLQAASARCANPWCKFVSIKACFCILQANAGHTFVVSRAHVCVSASTCMGDDGVGPIKADAVRAIASVHHSAIQLEKPKQAFVGCTNQACSDMHSPAHTPVPQSHVGMFSPKTATGARHLTHVCAMPVAASAWRASTTWTSTRGEHPSASQAMCPRPDAPILATSGWCTQPSCATHTHGHHAAGPG